MTLRSKFVLVAVLLYGAMLVLAWQLVAYNRWLFVAAEVLIVASLLFTVKLYTSFVRPLNLIAAGVESIRDRDFSIKFLKTGQKEVDQLVEVYNQMMEELRQERVVQTEKHFLLERLIEASPSGIILLDSHDRVAGLNPAAAVLLQASGRDLVAKPLADLPGHWGASLGKLPKDEQRIIRPNGIQTYRCRKIRFLDKGYHRYFILIEELTQELLEKERNAYEKLIRMMSHEINNSIGAVNSILHSFAYFSPQLDPGTRPDFDEALQVCITRNQNLAGFMANFANVVRIPPPTKQPVSLHELLHSIQRLMLPSVERKGVLWHWELDSVSPTVEVDVQQLEQVLINVVKNAVEAVEEGGWVKVKTVANPPQLLIQDNGQGIAPEVQEKLFSPFFSTKANGQGIGLTMVREILLQHGFPFSLQTGADGVTTFQTQFVS
ncbi:sensor histidine kinase [Rufibacter quisquiliarum]|uniref:histidine kinase n=1 Tax=Rufibacter quisquiliarum TaxID=1549639 RepID=A0A839GP04_9BACT|nr:ATP-binding protein [Rufibacter quisquiliarum]MBA9076168.1 nitrogen fixation/metabolism regulation signal transduction histidine kinase [Rufibacter quisquiliarum]